MRLANKSIIDQFIDKELDYYKNIAIQLHDNPETSDEEYFAMGLLTEILKNNNFNVSTDVAGHKTGFDARYKSKIAGPVIVFLAEYDALIGLGHACGHNLFGTTSLLAAIALKQVIEQIGGEIRVYGTPGEEGGKNGWAKDSFVKQGLFKDVDVALCVHPGYQHHLTFNTLAVKLVDIEFYGKAAHAAASPEKGINALDAVIQVYNAINAMRQQFTSDVRIHGIITHGGEAPNIIPAFASTRFFLRAASKHTVNNILKVVENIVKGAALATGSKYQFKIAKNSLDDTITVAKFDEIYQKNLAQYGVHLAKKREKGMGSSDVGNVSQVIPTIQPIISISETPITMHSLQSKLAARSEYGLSSIGLGAKVLALTAIDLILNPPLLQQIKLQHQENIKIKQV